MKKLPKFFPESTTLLCSTENYGKIKEKKKERCKMFAKKYSVLLLDADNTLFDFDASEARALQLAMEECALPFAPEYVAVYHRINDAKWKQLERGEITREQLVVERFAEFLQEIGGNSDKLAQLSEAYPRRLGQQRIPFPRAEEICASWPSLSPWPSSPMATPTPSTGGSTPGSYYRNSTESIFPRRSACASRKRPTLTTCCRTLGQRIGTEYWSSAIPFPPILWAESMPGWTPAGSILRKNPRRNTFVPPTKSPGWRNLSNSSNNFYYTKEGEVLHLTFFLFVFIFSAFLLGVQILLIFEGRDAGI